MAHDFKLNKSELSRKKREQKLYLQFLPILQLKQEQLQSEQIKLKRVLLEQERLLQKKVQENLGLIACLPDYIHFDIAEFCKIVRIHTKEKSIAGVKVEALDRIEFSASMPNIFGTPPWAIRGIPILRDFVRAKTEVTFLRKQLVNIQKELKKATQKVNLFDQLLIPKARFAIKKIQIALGDEQVASVARGKLAKSKSIAKSQKERVEDSAWQ